MNAAAVLPTPDNYRWPRGPEITGAEVADRALRVRWANGLDSRFHAIWLRDNCACPDCTHPVTREQKIDLLDIDENIAANSVAVDATGGLVVTWNGDGHQSLYDPGWLFAHAFASESRADECQVWSAADFDEPPSFDGPAAMQDDDALYDFLKAVTRFGIARLRGLPTLPDTVERFALRIGKIRETHFERIFNVLSRPDADSNAYTHAELPAHTDIPTRETPPGLQLLHCLVAEAEGGESVMADGFRIAEDLRQQDPQAFANLTSVNWTYANRAGDTDYRWAAPVIQLDDSGRVQEIRLASFSRAPLLADFDVIGESYRALRLFLRKTYESRYRMVYPFAAGDLVVFDNRRILHARKAFDPTTGARHLQGTYVDRDELYCRLRMIEHARAARELTAVGDSDADCG